MGGEGGGGRDGPGVGGCSSSSPSSFGLSDTRGRLADCSGAVDGPLERGSGDLRFEGRGDRGGEGGRVGDSGLAMLARS